MWTKLMVRLWAIRYEKAYRKKAVINTLLFISMVVILEEVFAIYFCGGLSVFGILAVIVFATLLAYTVLRRRRGNK